MKYLLIVKATGWPDIKVRQHVRTRLSLPSDHPMEVSWSTDATARVTVDIHNTQRVYDWYLEDIDGGAAPFPIGSLLWFREVT